MPSARHPKRRIRKKPAGDQPKGNLADFVRGRLLEKPAAGERSGGLKDFLTGKLHAPKVDKDDLDREIAELEDHMERVASLPADISAAFLKDAHELRDMLKARKGNVDTNDLADQANLSDRIDAFKVNHTALREHISGEKDEIYAVGGPGDFISGRLTKDDPREMVPHLEVFELEQQIELAETLPEELGERFLDEAKAMRDRLNGVLENGDDPEPIRQGLTAFKRKYVRLREKITGRRDDIPLEGNLTDFVRGRLQERSEELDPALEIWDLDRKLAKAAEHPAEITSEFFRNAHRLKALLEKVKAGRADAEEATRALDRFEIYHGPILELLTGRERYGSRNPNEPVAREQTREYRQPFIDNQIDALTDRIRLAEKLDPREAQPFLEHAYALRERLRTTDEFRKDPDNDTLNVVARSKILDAIWAFDERFSGDSGTLAKLNDLRDAEREGTGDEEDVAVGAGASSTGNIPMD